MRDASDDWNPPARRLGNGLKHRDSLVGSEGGKLPVSAAHNKSVHTVINHGVDIGGQTVQVDVQVLFHRGDEHNLDTFQSTAKFGGLHLFMVTMSVHRKKHCHTKIK